MSVPTLVASQLKHNAPTGSLDHVNAQVIGQMLLDLQAQEQVMLVCVTHNDELASGFDRQVRLDNGKLLEIV